MGTETHSTALQRKREGARGALRQEEGGDRPAQRCAQGREGEISKIEHNDNKAVLKPVKIQ